MSENKVELKKTLRREARRHRSRMDPGAEDMDTFADNFFESIKPEEGAIVATYWPKGREFDPGAVLERLLAKGFTCSLPVVKSESLELGFARWDESIELKKASYGIMEPAEKNWVEPDIIIVPLLAFDRRGYRLGQGGGYYDVTLGALREKKDIIAVGAAYARDAVLFNLPAEEHDQRLDWVITPEGTHCFEEEKGQA